MVLGCAIAGEWGLMDVVETSPCDEYWSLTGVSGGAAAIVLG